VERPKEKTMASADAREERKLQTLRDDVEDTIVDVEISVGDAVGGATDSLMSVQVKDQGGKNLAKVCAFQVVFGNEKYAGVLSSSATVSLGSVTKGEILYQPTGMALIKTDASGAFECTVTNSADETVWFNALSSLGGIDNNAHGVFVRGSVPDDATWSSP
jgi:hypothetical protein